MQRAKGEIARGALRRFASSARRLSPEQSYFFFAFAFFLAAFGAAAFLVAFFLADFADLLDSADLADLAPPLKALSQPLAYFSLEPTRIVLNWGLSLRKEMGGCW
jgi:hypothetical protein